MSQHNSNTPMFIIGFVVLALAAVFALNISEDTNKENIVADAEKPAPSAFDRAGEAAALAINDAQDAVAETATDIAKEADQLAEGVKEGAGELAADVKEGTTEAIDTASKAIDDMTAEEKATLAPAAGDSTIPQPIIPTDQ